MQDKRTVAERQQRGREIVSEMFGEKFLAAMETSRATKTFGRGENTSYGNIFADYWDRGIIDRKTRSLVTIAFLIALRTPDELKNHVRGALNNGCTVEEINEVLMQAQPYCGAPVAAAARAAAEDALRAYRAAEAELEAGGGS